MSLSKLTNDKESVKSLECWSQNYMFLNEQKSSVVLNP